MIKKLLAKLSDWSFYRAQKRLLDIEKQKVYKKYKLNVLRDRCIEYICKYDMSRDTVTLPPTQKADTILPMICRTEKQLNKYHQRFPYRLVIKALEECYGY